MSWLLRSVLAALILLASCTLPLVPSGSLVLKISGHGAATGRLIESTVSVVYVDARQGSDSGPLVGSGTFNVVSNAGNLEATGTIKGLPVGQPLVFVAEARNGVKAIERAVSPIVVLGGGNTAVSMVLMPTANMPGSLGTAPYQTSQALNLNAGETAYLWLPSGTADRRFLIDMTSYPGLQIDGYFPDGLPMLKNAIGDGDGYSFNTDSRSALLILRNNGGTNISTPYYVGPHPIAVATFSGMVYTSLDGGLNWEFRNSGLSAINDMTWFNGYFVAAGSYGGAGYGFSTSTDGNSWSAWNAGGSANDSIVGIAASSLYTAAIGYNSSSGNNYAIWFDSSLNPIVPGTAFTSGFPAIRPYWRDTTGFLWGADGGALYGSSNGSSWTAFGNASGLATVRAAAGAGSWYFQAGDNGAFSQVAFSGNGATGWTTTSVRTGGSYYDVAYRPEKTRLLAVGTMGSANTAVSTDNGATFTEHVAGSGNMLRVEEYPEGFLVGGTDGWLYKTTDGSSFTPIFEAGAEIRGIAYKP